MSDPLLAFDGVGLVLGRARVLDDLSFAMSPGERIAVIGPSSGGKSLILRLALGLLPATSGTVTLFGEDVGTLDPDALRRLRTRCGLTQQGGSLIAALSVEDNLRLAFGGQAPARLQRRIDRLLLDLDIAHVAARAAGTISASERRRVELARAFLRDPDLVLLDEPVERAQADAAGLEAVIHRHTELRGRAMLLVTQDAALAGRLAQRVLRLERGRLV